MSTDWNVSRHGGAVESTLSETEAYAMLAEDASAWMDFRSGLAGTLCLMTSGKVANWINYERRAELAEKAASSCPVKVGQEVYAKKGYGSSRYWWRVISIKGDPSNPVLACRNLKTDGSLGSWDQDIWYSAKLKVRDAGGETALPSLDATVERLNKLLAADPECAYKAAHKENKRQIKLRLKRYVYNGDEVLSLEDAVDYASWLEAGNRGNVWSFDSGRP